MLGVLKTRGLLLLFVVIMTSAKNEEDTSQFWMKLSESELETALLVEKNNNPAKNVILFLGDGMGVSTVTAGRILKGQLQGQSGEESHLEFDKFPHASLIKTYCVDKQVADSAATATAFLSGVKTNYYVTGLTAGVKLNDCEQALNEKNWAPSVFVDAFKSGKSCGIVTTTRVNHATPSAAYAQTANRVWYSDAELPEHAKKLGCKDIAQQFVDNAQKFDVVLGGGRKYFRPNTTFDPEYTDLRNKREDGKDLIADWKEKVGKNGKSWEYVWNKEQLDQVDIDNTDYLLGLFEPTDMKYDANRKLETGSNREPSIAEMTSTAIKMLRKNDNGYFLLVEGGRIDHAHHAGNAHLSLHDTVAFDDAVARALDMTSQSDTLIIVTADHSHTFTIGGYTERGNPILGEAPFMSTDGKPFTTLLYGNGPGSVKKPDEKCGRENITGVDTESKSYLQQSAVPLGSGTHGGEDVSLHAVGPMSHLFQGVKEQTYIAKVIRYAACVGDDITNACSNKMSSSMFVTEFLGMYLDQSSTRVALYVQFVFLLCVTLFSFVVTALFCRHLRLRHVIMDKYDERRRLDNKL